MLLAGHSELNEYMRKYQSFNQTSVGKFCYYLIVLLVMSREHRFDEAADLVLKVWKTYWKIACIFCIINIT